MVKKFLLHLFATFGLLANILVFLIIAIADNLKCDYLFTAISSTWAFVVCLSVCIILPSIYYIATLLVLKSPKKTVTATLAIILIVMLCINIPASFLVCGFTRGGITSYTEKLDNYLVFDRYVSESFDRYSEDMLFPDSNIISQNSKYLYNYDYGAISDNYHISLEASFLSEKNYSDEVLRIESLEYIEKAKGTYEKISDDNRFLITIVINYDTQIIKYNVEYN